MKSRGRRVYVKGGKHIRILQGIKLSPKIDNKIEPFVVNETNGYWLNKSNLTNSGQSCRFDVAEVSDGDGGSIYGLVLAIFGVERKGTIYNLYKIYFTFYNNNIFLFHIIQIVTL